MRKRASGSAACIFTTTRSRLEWSRGRLIHHPVCPPGSGPEGGPGWSVTRYEVIRLGELPGDTVPGSAIMFRRSGSKDRSWDGSQVAASETVSMPSTFSVLGKESISFATFPAEDHPLASIGSDT